MFRSKFPIRERGGCKPPRFYLACSARIFLCFVLAVSAGASAAPLSTAHAPPAADLMRIYLRIRDGVPPQLDAHVISGTSFQLSQDLKALLEKTKSAARKGDESCRRYFSDLSEASRQIDRLVMEFSKNPKSVLAASDSDFLKIMRLQVLIAGFLELALLMQTGAEGGFGILDQRDRTSCQVEERPAVLGLLKTVSDDLGPFSDQAFGVPSIAQMDATKSRLLHLIDKRDHRNTRNFWILSVVSTVAGLLAWDLCPPAAAAMTELLFGRPLALGRWGAYFTRTTAIAAETGAFMYVDQNITSPKESLPNLGVLLGTWKERMNEVERILESPLNSPELLTVHITRLQALRYSAYLPWLGEYEDVIQEQEQKYGSVERAVEVYGNQK